MQKKLYRVRVTLYIMAENASGACVAATKAPFDIFECHARKADHVEAGWEQAIPYNADDDRTCAEVLISERALQPFAPFPASGVRPRGLFRASLDTAERPPVR